MEKSVKKYLLERKEDKVVLILGLTYMVLCLASSIHFIIVCNLRNMALAWMDMLLFPLILGVEYLLSMQFSKGFIALCLFMGIGGGQLGSCYISISSFPCGTIFCTRLQGYCLRGWDTPFPNAL